MNPPTQPDASASEACGPLPPRQRVRALLFFMTLGVILILFTLIDVAWLFLMKKRSRGLGLRGALWRLALTPTRRDFWVVGAWIVLAFASYLAYQYLTRSGAPFFTAELP